ncbi:MAG: hypothetical protein HY897_04655 [Deltaproteobacteria bacterium]|nr:hypothetical protein [Deltaproteobacteria bacterium]
MFSRVGTVSFLFLAASFAPAPAIGADLPGADPKADDLFGSLKKHYDANELDRASGYVDRLETARDLSEAQRTDVLQYKAFIQVLTGRDDEAAKTIGTIYERKPEYALPAGTSEKIQAAFAKHRPSPKKDETRTISAVPVGPAAGPAPVAETGRVVDFAKKNWLSLISGGCVGVGLGLLASGIAIAATADAERARLEDAPRDDAGRLIRVTYEDAKLMQDEADRKAVTGGILIGAGSAAIVGGVTTFILYYWKKPDGSKKDGAKKAEGTFDVKMSPDGVLVGGAWDF